MNMSKEIQCLCPTCAAPRYFDVESDVAVRLWWCAECGNPAAGVMAEVHSRQPIVSCFLLCREVMVHGSSVRRCEHVLSVLSTMRQLFCISEACEALAAQFPPPREVTAEQLAREGIFANDDGCTDDDGRRLTFYRCSKCGEVVTCGYWTIPPHPKQFIGECPHCHASSQVMLDDAGRHGFGGSITDDEIMRFKQALHEGRIPRF